MKPTTNKVILCCLLILALLATFVTGCKGKEPETTTAPLIPPVYSFVIDFNDFTSEANASPTSGSAASFVQQASFASGSGNSYSSAQYAIGSYQNWGFAAWNVGVWSAIIVVGLAVPVAAFVESFNHTPQQQTDYSWIWSYDVTVGGGVYTAELHGKFIDNGVRWEMYISKQGEYTDFLWYYGESNLPATEGFWILKNNPSDPTDLIRIDWERDLAEGTHEIKYTNIVPGGPENGGYILHGVRATGSYDRFFDLFNKGQDNYTYIEWNSTTKEGRVKDAKHFGDDEWHYWDSNHIDVDITT